MLNDVTFAPRPYVMSAGRPNTVGANKLGYRDFPSIKKPADEFRIMIIGGSTVFLGNNLSLSRILETELSSLKKNIKVYNIGAVSSLSRQDVNRLIFDIAAYAPDIVVHYGPGNDFLTYIDPRINYPHRYVLHEHLANISLSSHPKDLILSVLFKSHLFKKLFAREYLDSILQKYKIVDKDLDTELRKQSYFQNIFWMQKISEILNAQFVAVFQPMLPFKSHLSPTEQSLAFATDKEFSKFWIDLRLNIVDTFSSKEHHFLDCSQVFKDEKERVFIDTIHLLDQYRVRPAKCISLYLAKHGFFDRQPNLKIQQLIPEELFFIDQN